jgi:hypothetical protein
MRMNDLETPVSRLARLFRHATARHKASWTRSSACVRRRFACATWSAAVPGLLPTERHEPRRPSTQRRRPTLPEVAVKSGTSMNRPRRCCRRSLEVIQLSLQLCGPSATRLRCTDSCSNCANNSPSNNVEASNKPTLPKRTPVSSSSSVKGSQNGSASSGKTTRQSRQSKRHEEA